MKVTAQKIDRDSERIAHDKAAEQSSATRHLSGGRAEAPDLDFRDHRSASLTQRRLQQAIDASPRQAAQGKRLASLFGPAVQRLIPEQKEPLQGKFAPVQRQESEEEEILQGKFDLSQPQVEAEEEPLQGRFDSGNTTTESHPETQSAENRTGIPDALKLGLETLSGMDLSDVRVHANSHQPAQLNALAYAQGNHIHLGPGQEQHLPHEAWHVVQQRQGRVRPTMQLGDVPVNDDVGLEKEADIMGDRASTVQRKTPVARSTGGGRNIHGELTQKPGNHTRSATAASNGDPVQLVRKDTWHKKITKGDQSHTFYFTLREEKANREWTLTIYGSKIRVDKSRLGQVNLAIKPNGALHIDNMAIVGGQQRQGYGSLLTEQALVAVGREMIGEAIEQHGNIDKITSGVSNPVMLNAMVKRMVLEMAGGDMVYDSAKILGNWAVAEWREQ
ncbi:MAG: DUF4157 domain-containing protein, partial [Chromatiales bacterium]